MSLRILHKFRALGLESVVNTLSFWPWAWACVMWPQVAGVQPGVHTQAGNGYLKSSRKSRKRLEFLYLEPWGNS